MLFCIFVLKNEMCRVVSLKWRQRCSLLLRPRSDFVVEVKIWLNITEMLLSRHLFNYLFRRARMHVRGYLSHAAIIIVHFVLNVQG